VPRLAPLILDPVQRLRSYALGDRSDQLPIAISPVGQLVCL